MEWKRSKNEKNFWVLKIKNPAKRKLKNEWTKKKSLKRSVCERDSLYYWFREIKREKKNYYWTLITCRLMKKQRAFWLNIKRIKYHGGHLFAVCIETIKNCVSIPCSISLQISTYYYQFFSFHRFSMMIEHWVFGWTESDV